MGARASLTWHFCACFWQFLRFSALVRLFCTFGLWTLIQAGAKRCCTFPLVFGFCTFCLLTFRVPFGFPDLPARINSQRPRPMFGSWLATARDEACQESLVLHCRSHCLAEWMTMCVVDVHLIASLGNVPLTLILICLLKYDSIVINQRAPNPHKFAPPPPQVGPFWGVSHEEVRIWVCSFCDISEWCVQWLPARRLREIRSPDYVRWIHFHRPMS